MRESRICVATRIAALFAVCLCSVFAAAEERASALDGLELTAEERAAVEPIYQEYQAAISDVRERLAKLLVVAVGEKKLSYYDVEQSIDDFGLLAREESVVRKRFNKRFRKVLPPRKLLRLMQLDVLEETAARCTLLDGSAE